MLRELFRSRARTKPTEPPPVIRRNASDFLSAPASGLRVTWLGHSTSIVELGGRRFLVDPMWSERASPFGWMGPKRFFEPPLPLDELPPLDAVLISHDHYDHLDRPTLERLAADGHHFLVPLGVGSRMTRWGIPSESIRELDWWDAAEVEGVTITVTPARHFSGRSPFGFDRNTTLWCGFVLRSKRHRVYYTGDTAMFTGFDEIRERLGPFDVTLIEIGAYSRLWADLHLGPEQAVEAFERVRGGLLVPVHWGTFDLAFHAWTEPVERLLVEAGRRQVPVVVPRPGRSFEPAEPPMVERWWPDVPWQSAEEHPIVSSGLE